MIPNIQTMTMSDAKEDGYDRLSAELCSLFWFPRFSLGCLKRLGQDWHPNRALCNPLMVKLLNSVETKIRTTSNPNEWLGFVVAGAYFLLLLRNANSCSPAWPWGGLKFLCFVPLLSTSPPCYGSIDWTLGQNIRETLRVNWFIPSEGPIPSKLGLNLVASSSLSLMLFDDRCCVSTVRPTLTVMQKQRQNCSFAFVFENSVPTVAKLPFSNLVQRMWPFFSIFWNVPRNTACFY